MRNYTCMCQYKQLNTFIFDQVQNTVNFDQVQNTVNLLLLNGPPCSIATPLSLSVHYESQLADCIHVAALNKCILGILTKESVRFVYTYSRCYDGQPEAATVLIIYYYENYMSALCISSKW